MRDFFEVDGSIEFLFTPTIIADLLFTWLQYNSLGLDSFRVLVLRVQYKKMVIMDQVEKTNYLYPCSGSVNPTK